ncbi:MAG: MATE family efflux transporter [Candidatus Eisenbacteria bacterium]|nr:MATE family efflux transporter [Candidatus Eisenbacteria bacterium]
MSADSSQPAQASSSDSILLTEGRILPVLLRLSWPVLLSMSLQTLFHIVDAIWVGRLGADALAAVSTCVYATWILGGIGELLSSGVVALASRDVGAGRQDSAWKTAGQAQSFAWCLGIVLVAAAPTAPRALFTALSTTPEVTRLGIEYLSPLLYFAVPALLLATLAAILRAWGDTKTALRITAVSVTLNLVLDPLLIFGFGPIPALGVKGAAYATLLSQSIGVTLFYLHLRGRFGSLRLPFPQRSTILSIARIGLPVTMNAALYAFVYLWFAGVAARIDTNAVAVLGVGNRLESVVYILAESLSLAAAAFVGQNLGGQRVDRVRTGVRWALVIGFAVGAVFGVLFFTLGRPLFSLFTSDPTVLADAGPYMQILALCQGFMAVEVTLYGVFAGAGYTLVPTVVSGLVHAMRVPLASWVALRLGYGLEGLAWMITLTCVLRSLWLAAVLARGRWLGHRADPTRATIAGVPGSG